VQRTNQVAGRRRLPAPAEGSCRASPFSLKTSIVNADTYLGFLKQLACSYRRSGSEGRGPAKHLAEAVRHRSLDRNYWTWMKFLSGPALCARLSQGLEILPGPRRHETDFGGRLEKQESLLDEFLDLFRRTGRPAKEFPVPLAGIYYFRDGFP
jgi:hypothetical protein